ncbi:response regulator [Microvirga alba]|uniref:Response regulator n=1 Tax=Microvirga alba TaxID=2791025 RepID=A0A931FP81_9HYPH|nr:response regulator [Microvirga alba]MBF9234470.1 response regulator [Microvirga alba]
MRVLILEDDPFIALDLQTILENEGHEIVGVSDSLVEARRYLDETFDCALLDIDLIDGKSFGVAAELLERQIPFAFVTASPPAEVPHFLQLVLFIPKPFEEAAILRSIELAVPSRSEAP